MTRNSKLFVVVFALVLSVFTASAALANSIRLATPINAADASSNNGSVVITTSADLSQAGVFTDAPKETGWEVFHCAALSCDITLAKGLIGDWWLSDEQHGTITVDAAERNVPKNAGITIRFPVKAGSDGEEGGEGNDGEVTEITDQLLTSADFVAHGFEISNVQTDASGKETGYVFSANDLKVSFVVADSWIKLDANSGKSYLPGDTVKTTEEPAFTAWIDFDYWTEDPEIITETLNTVEAFKAWGFTVKETMKDGYGNVSGYTITAPEKPYEFTLADGWSELNGNSGKNYKPGETVNTATEPEFSIWVDYEYWKNHPKVIGEEMNTIEKFKENGFTVDSDRTTTNPNTGKVTSYYVESPTTGYYSFELSQAWDHADGSDGKKYTAGETISTENVSSFTLWVNENYNPNNPNNGNGGSGGGGGGCNSGFGIIAFAFIFIILAVRKNRS